MSGFDPILLGSVANDRTGDKWRVGGTKINAMLQELFDSFGADDAVYVSQESDFPTQDATTITLEASTPYIGTGSFTTSKQFIAQDGSSFLGRSVDAHVVTFTGSGAMFSGVDVGFTIKNVALMPGTGNQIFDFSETVGGTKKFISNLVEDREGALKWGTFEKLQLVEIFNSSNLPTTSIGDGIEVKGATTLVSIDRFGLFSTSAGFKGIDLGTSVVTIPEISNLFMIAPAGAFGISGLASSGNIPVGSLAMIQNSEFLGGMTDLENITTKDIRYRFSDNNPTPDTVEDALLSFNGNISATTIGVGDGDNGNPKLLTAIWKCIDQSFFTCSTAGRATFIGERGIRIPIDVVVGLISSGGGAIDVTVYLAKNGSVITDSATTASISGSNQAFVMIPWQDDMIKDAFYEVFVENNTNTTDIIVESGKLRLR